MVAYSLTSILEEVGMKYKEISYLFNFLHYILDQS